MPAVKNFRKYIPDFLHRSELFYVIFIDLEGIHRYVNLHYAKRFRHISENHTGLRFSDTVTPEDTDKAWKAGERCLKNPERPVGCILRIPDENGGVLFTEWEFTAVEEGGITEGVLAVGSDLTELRRKEEELRAGENTLLNISRSIEDIFFTTDMNLVPTFISASVETVMGYRPDEVIGEPLEKRFSIETHKQFIEVLREELEKEKNLSVPAQRTRQIEGIQYRADGAPRNVSVKVSFLRDASGKPVGVQGVTRDITASKEREKALEIATERYEQISEISRTVIWETDLDGRYTFINRAVKKLYGFDPEDIIGKLYFYDIHPPEGRGKFKEEILEKMRKGECWSAIEKPLIDAYGKHHYILSFGMPRYDEEGSIIGYRGSGMEITAIKDAEIKLKESHERFESLADAGGTVVWEIDKNGRFTYVTPTSAKVYGRAPEEVIGKMFYELHPEEGRAEFKRLGLDIISSQKAITGLENKMQHPDGRVVWISTTGLPLRNETGQFIGYRGSDTDITSLKRAQGELEEREIMLRGLLREKDAATRMQSLLFETAEQFINLPLGEVTATVDGSLRKIGEYAGADRCYIFKFSEKNGRTAKEVFEWTSPGITPAEPALRKVDVSVLEELSDTCCKSMIIHDLQEEEEGCIPEAFLAGRGVRSLLVVPLKPNTGSIGWAVMETAEARGDFGHRELRVMEIFTGLLLNVEEREHTEKELVRMQLMLEQAGQMSRVGAFELLPESGLQYWSAVTKSIHEVPPDYDPSIEKAIAFYKHEKDREAVAAMVACCMNTGKPFDFEYPIITAEGNERIVKVSGRGDVDKGACTRLFGTIQDVTEERKKGEKERILLEITQNQNDRLKNFAHIVAHNLRSHSGNIESLLGLIESTREDLKDFDLMKLLRRVSDSLRDTLGHLSEVAMLHSAEREPLRDLKLKDHVERAVETVCGEALAAETKIVRDVPSDLTLRAIPAYLDSILLNLLTNAIKYRKPNQPCIIRLSAIEEGRFVRLSVADNGLGIDMERHGAKLFGMFKTFHDHPEARGIGLFITKNQIESMGGRVDVISAPGEGSTFRISLLRGEGE